MARVEAGYYRETVVQAASVLQRYEQLCDSSGRCPATELSQVSPDELQLLRNDLRAVRERIAAIRGVSVRADTRPSSGGSCPPGH